ncbi:MAG: GTPase domain-containing protein, partial [Lachnospiraceae bacterium]
MAGKSTLMEILTEGDGKTIGKGAQRTTRDVRQYTWKGLKITDVPGIGAFEGEEDEQIAFETAKTADLILFLITDDAPQASEADCFSRVVNLGKPIICIMNVKASVTEGKSLRLATRDIQKNFDMKRLGIIRKQFLGHAERFGQTWNHIPFVYVHLKSAFLSQKPEDAEQSKLYYQMSRIDYLKSKITEQVRNKGEFFRIKTFIDII